MRFCPLLWGIVGTCSKVHQTTVFVAVRNIIHSCDTISFELYCFCLGCFNNAVVLWAWDALWKDTEQVLLTAHWVICGRAKTAAGKYVQKANLENLYSVLKTGLCNAALCKTQAACKDLTAQISFSFIACKLGWVCKKKLWFPLSYEIWTLLYIPDL